MLFQRTWRCRNGWQARAWPGWTVRLRCPSVPQPAKPSPQPAPRCLRLYATASQQQAVQETSIPSDTSAADHTGPHVTAIATDEFDLYYPLVQAYVRDKQQPPPLKYVVDGLHVGQWVKRLQHEYRTGLVLAKHAEQMEALPGWRWGGRKGSKYAPFEQHAARVNAFCAEHGHMPRNIDRYQGERLGIWCSERRTDYKLGRVSATLAAAFLQHIPAWSWNAAQDGFQENLALLHAFAADQGRMPTQKDSLGGKHLGRWVNKQRLKYRSGRMSQEDVAALEAVPGWWWSAEELFTMLEAQEQEAAAAAAEGRTG